MDMNQFPSLPQEKFVLVNENKPLRDKELVTKPRGFFADAMYRFSRNKGSIVGAIVIGILVLYAIIAPLCTPYTVSYNDGYYRYTLPKLFTSENIDFLDGCSKKTLNETSFLYYYAMGEESGSNAIKRQEYTRALNTHDQMMYTFRLDSYRRAGQVFISGVTPAEFASIQEYQDAHDVQIVYPITDLEKRPAAQQNKTDANYWFETSVGEGNKTAITGYTENADGSFSFTNIYAPYTVPALKSGQSFENAKTMNVTIKDGDYYLSFFTPAQIVKKEADGSLTPITQEDADAMSDEEKAETPVIYIDEHEDFFTVTLEDDQEAIVCVADIEEATPFEYDATLHTFLCQVNGHEDPAMDGKYGFGIPMERGSVIDIVPLSDFESNAYLPFSAYSDETHLVENPENGGKYYFTSSRPSTETKKVYVSSSLQAVLTTGASSESSLLRFSDNGSGDMIMAIKEGRFYNTIGLNATATGVAAVKVTSNANAAIWQFDAVRKTVYTTVNGHENPALDGNYYLALAEDGALSFVLEADITDDTQLFVLVDTEFNEATALTDGGNYYLKYESSFTTYTTYYATGGFNGDNYTSKMRIEGDGNYQYSYARETNGTYEIRVNYYRYYTYYHQVVLKDGIGEPFFLFGTTNSGQDIFVCLASGARFSFIMAIVVAVVNMVVGAIYGAIEGYYGGRIDLVMERIVEILSAIPFMIVITLLKYHMGGASPALILFIAFFLTGWIGESGTVRMQFYRFKNQEYVLASRTLGAKDWRIMFRHIFPNALGTIVTGSVLVIPGMIFSETSLSYLGIINLNSGTMTSVGTLLANGQPYLTTYPHIILFPAIFISLLMLCFNLFGNGLRDAFNPSLRGTED